MHTHIKHNIKMALLTLTEHFHTASPIPFYKKTHLFKNYPPRTQPYSLTRTHTVRYIHIKGY